MLKTIKTKKNYESALKRAYELMQKNLKKGSKLSNELKILSVLIKTYEDEHYPIIIMGTKKQKNIIFGIVDPKVSNYEKHPFFVKKANEAKALLKAVGLPKKLAKAK
jgi:hypothetical protein